MNSKEDKEKVLEFFQEFNLTGRLTGGVHYLDVLFDTVRLLTKEGQDLKNELNSKNEVIRKLTVPKIDFICLEEIEEEDVSSEMIVDWCADELFDMQDCIGWSCSNWDPDDDNLFNFSVKVTAARSGNSIDGFKDVLDMFGNCPREDYWKPKQSRVMWFKELEGIKSMDDVRENIEKLHVLLNWQLIEQKTEEEFNPPKQNKKRKKRKEQHSRKGVQSKEVTTQLKEVTLLSNDMKDHWGTHFRDEILKMLDLFIHLSNKKG